MPSHTYSFVFFFVILCPLAWEKKKTWYVLCIKTQYDHNMIQACVINELKTFWERQNI